MNKRCLRHNHTPPGFVLDPHFTCSMRAPLLRSLAAPGSVAGAPSRATCAVAGSVEETKSTLASLGWDKGICKLRGPVQNFRRRRTKMKITRAVELRSSKFWMFWKATNLLFRLSTGFMGVGARYPAAPTPQVRGAHFFSKFGHLACLRAPAYLLESFVFGSHKSFPRYNNRHAKIVEPFFCVRIS